MTETKKNLARCPITGQAGLCPSAAASLDLSTSSSAALALSPKEQQANLWQSLLERNGHTFSRARRRRPTKVNNSKLNEDEGHFPSPSEHCPELAHANSSSFNTTGSDSDSVCSETPKEENNNSSSSSTNNASSLKKEAKAPRNWPTYDQVSAHVLVADYQESLTSGADQHPVASNSTKLLCPHGVVCQAKLEFFEAPDQSYHKKYTGLLTPGTTVEHCLLRLSSALRPVDHGGGAWAKALARRTFGAKLSASQILPAAALKCFRHNHASGNVLLMGSKVGQPSRNIFEHALCTAVTEKIPALGLPFLRRFSRYSKYPLSLGLSELCQYDASGQAANAQEHNFPFALCLQPVVQWPTRDNHGKAQQSSHDDDSDDDRPFDAFIDDVPQHVPAGTHLFDIYAAPTPESVGASHHLQRIGKVVSTSPFVYSSPTDGLTFRHQVKEDDLQLQPTWEDRMHSHIIQYPSDGTRGTVAKMTGWQILEEHIMERGDYVDFEQKRHHTSPPKKTCSVSLAEPSSLRVPGWNFCGFRKARVAVSS